MRREAAGLRQAPRFKSTFGLFILRPDLFPSSVNCKMFDYGIPKTQPPLLFDTVGKPAQFIVIMEFHFTFFFLQQHFLTHFRLKCISH